MAFDTPDLRTLNTRAQADIEAELPGTNARLRRSNLNVLARVMAGIAHGMYGFIREFLSQCLPWSKGFLLRMWAEIWGVFQLSAVAAQGPVIFTGTEGSPIAADTRLQSADELEYATVSDATITGGVASVNVIAVVPGIAGNQVAGTVLTLVTPVFGVAASATVDAAGLTEGTDDESLDGLYIRYQQRVQNPAHGGNVADYEGWAMDVPGVTRAWVYGGLDGDATVQVYFVRDNDASIIPDATEVATVQAYINDPTRKPVAATVGVYAPTAKVINYTIVAVPSTPLVRAAIEQELRDLTRREADLGGTILWSHLNEAISLAEGETDHTLIAPAGNVVCLSNEIATFGAITWM
ncbi:baseplate J/gp47 family protein [Collimonas pratensis]|uniref:Baseplate J-like family protein n=1 Tax=Collimonas pratensis TaxID=279113 RepID=A0ABM5Z3N6_9BURK|nr:baseplate J/gp47 family protein [Collimonas pratensis]AMP13685.1 baseplate J-like family protein [Collimonas pratensis]